jgi:NAD(P)-dependent dehydrogenase (short-subunit alcohol dehydrogenase family)
VPGAHLDFSRLDTSDPASVRDFADRWWRRRLSIDILLLNAGISNVPTREITPDGYERQFATNYLGHFALTGLLLPHMSPASGSRVVWVSSLQSRRAELHVDDLQLAQHYSPMRAYGQSKLAMLTAALELDRRLLGAGSSIASLAAHPGVSASGIVRGGDRASPLRRRLTTTLFGLVGQPASQGALPLLYATTDPDAHRGGFYGPDGRGERRGAPAPARISARAQDPANTARLWERSEQLGGVTYHVQPL